MYGWYTSLSHANCLVIIDFVMVLFQTENILVVHCSYFSWTTLIYSRLGRYVYQAFYMVALSSIDLYVVPVIYDYLLFLHRVSTLHIKLHYPRTSATLNWLLARRIYLLHLLHVSNWCYLFLLRRVSMPHFKLHYWRISANFNWLHERGNCSTYYTSGKFNT